jgi:hypothetical protein
VDGDQIDALEFGGFLKAAGFLLDFTLNGFLAWGGWLSECALLALARRALKVSRKIRRKHT